MKPLISFAKKRFGRKHHLKKFFMGYSFMIVFLFLFAIFLLWKFNAAYTSLITEDKKELACEQSTGKCLLHQKLLPDTGKRSAEPGRFFPGFFFNHRFCLFRKTVYG